MKHHDLKCDPVPFVDVMCNGKRCEIRKDDRGFEVGDTFRLLETGKSRAQYTGREAGGTIEHVQRGYGLQEGHVALTICVEYVLR